jgi:hypothetical protein
MDAFILIHLNTHRDQETRSRETDDRGRITYEFAAALYSEPSEWAYPILYSISEASSRSVKLGQGVRYQGNCQEKVKRETALDGQAMSRIAQGQERPRNGQARTCQAESSHVKNRASMTQSSHGQAAVKAVVKPQSSGGQAAVKPQSSRSQAAVKRRSRRSQAAVKP